MINNNLLEQRILAFFTEKAKKPLSPRGITAVV